MWLGVAPRMDIRKNVFKRDWTIYSKYDNHRKLNGQHNWGGGYMN